ncbi:LytR/AlgR family response regulator transcription factor [Pedobacter punctiformis]|uniref:Response regulator n=1 Tax=Pedobacter punctiformis TaxID=3004097 RepID=A0ABT4L7W9_9SPHI|nr:response regulator [Pedobacter sp. HCMS5-2]MCZ4243926.1 response regulator [Pedobacter sp. HCMS5-2]
MPISCIAIDDDPSSLENLMAYMSKLPDLNLVKSFTEPLKALQEISASNPVDIIFMDVEMPAISGIELASLLRQKTKYLVFTTAHAKYAIDAFKVDADAYLLKPYSILHFAKTINNLYPSEKKKPLPFSISENHFYIPIQTIEENLARIDLNELIAVEILKEDIHFKTLKNNYLSPKLNFLKIVKMLSKYPTFIQVNPKTVISKQYIKNIIGEQIFLFKSLSYRMEEPFKEAFSDFVKRNLLLPGKSKIS